MPGQGATQGPEGRALFILYSLTLLKGSRAIKKTHGRDEFPWLSVAAGWGSCDEWSGKENEGRRADWKENEEEKSRRESVIKDSKEKTRGGSADRLLSSCQLFPFCCCCWRGFLCSAQHPAAPSPPRHAPPAGLGLLPLPFPLCYRHLSKGTTTEPVRQRPKDKRKSPGTARNPQTERARVYLYIAEDLRSGRHMCTHAHHHSLL